jgi:hypothetical protein
METNSILSPNRIKRAKERINRKGGGLSFVYRKNNRARVQLTRGQCQRWAARVGPGGLRGGKTEKGKGGPGCGLVLANCAAKLGCVGEGEKERKERGKQGREERIGPTGLEFPFFYFKIFSNS